MAVQVKDRIDVQTILNTAVIPAETLSINLLLIDDAEVPTDQRVISCTASDYGEYFESTGAIYPYAQTYFGQKRTPETLQVGRWVKVAAPAYSVFPDVNTTVATWEAIEDGSFDILVGAVPTSITGVDLSGATTMAQVFGLIEDKIQAGFADTGATLGFGSQGRVVFTSPANTGAAKSVSIEPKAVPAGTDLAALLGYTTQAINAGTDAETIAQALDAIDAIDPSGIFITLHSDADADILAFAAAIESREKIGCVMSADEDIKDSGVTDDIFSQLRALNYTKTAGLYYEDISTRPTMYPWAAVLGAVIPAKEGTCNFAWEALSGITGSGYGVALSSAATDVVRGKGGCVVENVKGITYMFDGLTFSRDEVRVIYGRLWFNISVRNDLFSYLANTPLAAFDDETLGVIESTLNKYSQEAIARRIIVNTEARPLVITLPSADQITQAMRASHKLTVNDAFLAYLNSAINEMLITGTWSI